MVAGVEMTKKRKKISCLLGLHNWKTFVSDGESYLKCPHCGKYGGTPTRLIGGWGYKDPYR